MIIIKETEYTFSKTYPKVFGDFELATKLCKPYMQLCTSTSSWRYI